MGNECKYLTGVKNGIRYLELCEKNCLWCDELLRKLNFSKRKSFTEVKGFDWVLLNRIYLAPTFDYVEYYFSNIGVYEILIELFRDLKGTDAEGDCRVFIDFEKIKGFSIPVLTINLISGVQSKDKAYLEKIEDQISDKSPRVCGYLSDSIIVKGDDRETIEEWTASFNRVNKINLYSNEVISILPPPVSKRLNELSIGFFSSFPLTKLSDLKNTELKEQLRLFELE